MLFFVNAHIYETLIFFAFRDGCGQFVKFQTMTIFFLVVGTTL